MTSTDEAPAGTHPSEQKVVSKVPQALLALQSAVGRARCACVGGGGLGQGGGWLWLCLRLSGSLP